MKIKQHIASFILLIILFITSIGTYLCYPLINQAIQKSNFEKTDISDYVTSHLVEYSYASDFLLKQNQFHFLITTNHLQITSMSLIMIFNIR